MLYFVTSILAVTAQKPRQSEILPRETQESMGIIWRGNSSNSHDLLTVPEGGFPTDYTWWRPGPMSFHINSTLSNKTTQISHTGNRQ